MNAPNINDLPERAARDSQQGLVKCECGNNTFEKRTRVAGIWTSTLTISAGGRITTEGNGDCVRTLAEPKYVRCEQCGKRHRNPEALNVEASQAAPATRPAKAEK